MVLEYFCPLRDMMCLAMHQRFSVSKRSLANCVQWLVHRLVKSTSFAELLINMVLYSTKHSYTSVRIFDCSGVRICEVPIKVPLFDLIICEWFVSQPALSLMHRCFVYETGLFGYHESCPLRIIISDVNALTPSALTVVIVISHFRPCCMSSASDNIFSSGLDACVVVKTM